METNKQNNSKQKRAPGNTGQPDGCQRRAGGGMSDKAKGNVVTDSVVMWPGDR